jgi:hypothetical protein
MSARLATALLRTARSQYFPSLDDLNVILILTGVGGLILLLSSDPVF